MTFYLDEFSAANTSGTEAIAAGKDILKHVSNDTLNAKVEKLSELDSTIPQDISDKNFGTLDTDISNYQNLTLDVENLTSSVTAVYDGARDAKNSANSLLLILETQDTDPIAMKNIGLLMNQTQDLDAQFRDGLDVSQLSALQANFTSIENDAKSLMNNEREMPATKALDLFRGFARQVNVGIYALDNQMEIIPPQSIPQSAIPLGLFSLLLFVSLGSIAIVAFLYVVSTFRFSVPNTGHILAAAFVCAMMALLGFSLFTYLFLGKTSTDASMQEFAQDFSARNSTSIFVNLSGVSLSDAKSMQSCASELANSLAGSNKTWAIYSITPNTCSSIDWQGHNASLSASQCENLSQSVDSAFDLSYSADNPVPRFSVIYQNRAEIAGDSDYYDSCPVVAFFS